MKSRTIMSRRPSAWPPRSPACRRWRRASSARQELIEAAKKEGTLVYYTANFTEVEQEIIKAFNKRFPIKVEMVRAPGGQLITRSRPRPPPASSSADVVDHSDRGLMMEIIDLFQDYAPPNAADYLPDVLVSPKLWPRRHAGLVDRLQHRAGEEAAEDLDGSHQAGIRQTSRSAR